MQVTEESREALAQLLVSAAWADGELDEQEKKTLQICFTRLGCAPRFEDVKVTEEVLDAAKHALPERLSRIEFLTNLMKVAYADELLAYEEFDLICRVADKLEIPHDQVETIRSQILHNLDPDSWSRIFGS